MHDSSLGKQDFEKKGNLAYAKGLGSAQNGSREWFFYQVFNFFSVIALVYLFCLITFKASSYSIFVSTISNPIYLSLTIISVLVLCRGSYFWIKEIITDYIDSHFWQLIFSILLRCILVFVSICSIISLLVVVI